MTSAETQLAATIAHVGQAASCSAELAISAEQQAKAAWTAHQNQPKAE